MGLFQYNHVHKIRSRYDYVLRLNNLRCTGARGLGVEVEKEATDGYDAT